MPHWYNYSLSSFSGRGGGEYNEVSLIPLPNQIPHPSQAAAQGLEMSGGIHTSTKVWATHHCRSENCLLLVHGKISTEIENKDLRLLEKLDNCMSVETNKKSMFLFCMSLFSFFHCSSTSILLDFIKVLVCNKLVARSLVRHQRWFVEWWSRC